MSGQKLGEPVMQRNLLYDKVTTLIENARQELVDLCMQLGNTPSPHGKERRVGEAVLAWLKDKGVDGYLQRITDECVNVIATMRGSGSGPSLIFNAHMDTGPELGTDATDEQKKLDTAWVEGDMLYGKGMINDKAQLCAFMLAMSALRAAGVNLKGDLTLTAVAYETGHASVDEFQGIDFPGEGFGTMWAVNRGVVADFALVGETSGFGIVQAECGAAWFKVRVKGREIYTPRLERGNSLRENPNAFVKAAHVMLALEQWAVDYEKRETMKFSGGTIIPKAQIVEARGGKGIGRPNENCDVYLDVRILPEKNPLTIQRELAELLAKLDLNCEISLFQFSRGHIIKDGAPLIGAVGAAHRYVFGVDPPAPPSAETSMWRDLNVFNEVGVPSICYGPPRQRDPLSGAGNRAMKIDDLMQATKVYALTALILCGVE
jgi:acetylornithine deacetylase/succinyl-diaminopimelate desuccinylase-like protein